MSMTPARITAIKQLLALLEQWAGRTKKSYEFWYKRAELARKDPDKFWELESTSGSAMADDPPEGWTRADLEKYFRGNVHGREIETGNLAQKFRYAARELKEALDEGNEYGSRRGFPTKEEIVWHAERRLIGLWIVQSRANPMNETGMATLRVENGEVQCYEGGGWRAVTTSEAREIVTSMPVDIEGCPVAWPKEEG